MSPIKIKITVTRYRLNQKSVCSQKFAILFDFPMTWHDIL